MEVVQSQGHSWEAARTGQTSQASLTVDKSQLTGLHGVELVFSTVRRHRGCWGDNWKDCVTRVLEHSICQWVVTFPSGISPQAQ